MADYNRIGCVDNLTYHELYNLGLWQHLEEMLETMVELVSEIDKQSDEIKGLKSEIEDLESQNSELLTCIDGLKGQMHEERELAHENIQWERGCND